MTTLTKEELEKLVAVAQMVADMADGLDMAAEAEVLVIDGLDKYAALFQADDRDPKTMRALRVYNEAKSNHRRFVKEAHALRTLVAENATLRAERDAAQSELDDCIASDWPIWAKQIYNTLKEFGYRYDHFDGIDLPEDVSEFLRGFPENAASELMEQRDDALQELATLRASEALTQSRAERAAAYERAAEMIREYPHFMLMTPDQKKVCVHLAQVILALRDKPAISGGGDE